MEKSRNYTWPLHSVLESDDRRVREDAFKAVYETYGKYKNTFASTLSGAEIITLMHAFVNMTLHVKQH